MKLSALANAAITPDPAIAGLTADSRAVAQGYLFAALPGTSVDGASYIPQAEERGAAAILARPGVRARVPIVFDENPNRRFAEMAARFYPRQPAMIAGITGTNGKTSTAVFASALWQMLGEAAGSIGTLGAKGCGFDRAIGYTTPTPVIMHETLDAMAEAGLTHIAMEVSSQGLHQYRADGVRFSVAAFTNLTQDHLDYHGDFAAYQAAKARLFNELLPSKGVAVINMDGEHADEFASLARQRHVRVIETGARGADLQLIKADPHSLGLNVAIRAGGAQVDLDLPLVGAFQAENVLLAAGIVIASGFDAGDVLPLLEKLAGVPGRMQKAAEVGAAGIFVDYAHTPDALQTALGAIRPHAAGRVIAIIGAGGDRDRAKRPLMGAAAARLADIVIVTDDNPRSEDPAAIRAAVLQGCPGAIEIRDRAAAIGHGAAMLQAGDVLLIAGKGHETGQQIGDQVLPFDDVETAKGAAARRIKELGV